MPIVPKVKAAEYSERLKIWTTRDGRAIHIEHMTTGHLINTVKLLERGTLKHIADCLSGEPPQTVEHFLKRQKFVDFLPVAHADMVDVLKRHGVDYIPVVTEPVYRCSVLVKRSAVNVSSIPQTGLY
jgi:hypothetical protein